MGKRGSKDVSRQVILHVLFRVGIKGGMVGVRVILHLVWCDGSGQLKYHYHPPWDQLDWYTSDLLCLDSCRPPDSTTTTTKRMVVRTPLVMSWWASALQAHPDQAFVRYVMEGRSRSLRIRLRDSHLTSASSNLHIIANLQPEAITSYRRR